jgi:Mu transposase, C-terminal
VGVYHHTVHSSLHQTPAAAWQHGLAQRSRPARQPQDRERFFLDFLPTERRLIRRDGIRVFPLHYWHNVLSPRAGRSKTRELIKYDPRNLSRVYWQDQQGDYWPIPCRNLALQPISLWEHDEAVRRLKAESQRGRREEAGSNGPNDIVTNCVSRHFSSKQARINSLMSGLFERKFLCFHEVLSGPPIRWVIPLPAGLILTHDSQALTMCCGMIRHDLLAFKTSICFSRWLSSIFHRSEEAARNVISYADPNCGLNFR